MEDYQIASIIAAVMLIQKPLANESVREAALAEAYRLLMEAKRYAMPARAAAAQQKT